jgi:hypothetical protein
MINAVELALSDGQLALVSAEDFERVSKLRWSVHSVKRRYKYVTTYTNGKHYHLHRFICGLERGDRRMVDHIDGDCLNNTRTNLRICTNTQNQWNKQKCKTPRASTFKGVHRWRDRFKAGITVNNTKNQL